MVPERSFRHQRLPVLAIGPHEAEILAALDYLFLGV